MPVMIEPRAEADRAQFDAALMAALKPLGLDLDRRHMDLMRRHFERVVEANRRFNLTRITTPAEAAVKHYADSLSLLALPGIGRNRKLTLLDVGTGAGFPAVPLAVVCPAWRITAIDGAGKKVRFVAETVGALGLKNIEARHARAADLAKELPGRFDLVVLRAVTKLAAGLAEVKPLIRSGGRIVFYKTATMFVEELEAGRRKAESLGLKMCTPVDIVVPAGSEDLHRRFIICERPAR
jgi:16S rRNA (guanine527-N7)-methyltransferase